MIKKYILFALILICILFTFTGCYDSTGIEDFYYIVAMGIDGAEKIKEMYELDNLDECLEIKDKSSGEKDIYSKRDFFVEVFDDENPSKITLELRDLIVSKIKETIFL